MGGIGKLAKAIPARVYERTADVVLQTFQEVMAPLTETTAGLGRYIRQKFDHMVETERAVAAYTVEEAIGRARASAQRKGLEFSAPKHVKMFVRTLEEASKEIDPLIHEMWTNLLASQLTSEACHPHFVELLSHFSPAEAKLLMYLLPREQLADHGGYISFSVERMRYWARSEDEPLHPWSLSCTLLYGWGFADVVTFNKTLSDPRDTILCRTESGGMFLAVVAPDTPTADQLDRDRRG